MAGMFAPGGRQEESFQAWFRVRKSGLRSFYGAEIIPTGLKECGDLFRRRRTCLAERGNQLCSGARGPVRKSSFVRC